MTARGFYTLFFGVLMIVTALSVGSAGAFLLGCAALCTAAVSLISVLIVYCTIRFHQEMEECDVTRGERCTYTLNIRRFSLLPTAPLLLLISLPNGRQGEFLLRLNAFGATVSKNRFLCPHVGVYAVGALSLRINDCFSLFSLSKRVKEPLFQVTVLPDPIKTEPLTFSPGEGEASAIERAQADPTTPSDTRIWQEGDEFKRIHWKLSMRRQQLIVHTYEQNQRPDALVLLDCAAPDVPENRRAAAIDLLTESCAGVIEALLEAGHAVRMPLNGGRESSGLGMESLLKMLHELATEPFSGSAEFSRVLALSARRMHRTGSTAIFTTRLTPRIAEDVIALSRMGPHTYFYLITAREANEEQKKLFALLVASGVESLHILINPS